MAINFAKTGSILSYFLFIIIFSLPTKSYSFTSVDSSNVELIIGVTRTAESVSVANTGFQLGVKRYFTDTNSGLFFKTNYLPRQSNDSFLRRMDIYMIETGLVFQLIESKFVKIDIAMGYAGAYVQYMGHQNGDNITKDGVISQYSTYSSFLIHGAVFDTKYTVTNRGDISIKFNLSLHKFNLTENYQLPGLLFSYGAAVYLKL